MRHLEITAAFFNTKGNSCDFGLRYADGSHLRCGSSATSSGAEAEAKKLAELHDVPAVAFDLDPRNSRAGHVGVTRNDYGRAVVGGAPFGGEKLLEPIAIHPEARVAAGKLASWLTTEDAGAPGVFRASTAVVSAWPETHSFVIVNDGTGLAAVTLKEAYERHLRETSVGVEWHRDSGVSVIAGVIAERVSESAEKR